MLTLTRDDVRLGCRAADWRAALDQAADALVEAGRVSAEYREGLLAREAQSSTYLGHGIAIPHGTPESRRYVRSTGVRVLQFPDGVRSYWPMPQEDNPFLGVRGIRLTLMRPEVLETQIRALLTAAGTRPVRIMFPMVKDIEEFRAGKAIFDRVQAEVKAADVQLGVMIEVPSCALLAPSLAKEADFFSIGTNDLTQYTLAIDRGHPQLSAQSDALHPAVLRLIHLTVEAAHAEGRWVGVCGELGSDPQAIPVLVGMGVDELSVSSRRVPLVKAAIRELMLPRARELAAIALKQPTAAAVREALEVV